MAEHARRSDGDPARPTMRDVAHVAGVHQTTVSLALRNHPSVSARTRVRIRAAAERLGYRPDPFLDAFNEHRRAVRPMIRSSTVAYVVDAAAGRDSAAVRVAELHWRGARRAAEERGLLIESFVVGPGHLSAERLDQILQTRGVAGVIIALSGLNACDLPLAWQQYAGVRIESPQLSARLDGVSADPRFAVRLAVAELRRIGYRRIGLATAATREAWPGERLISGFLLSETGLAPSDRVPPCLLDPERGPEGAGILLDWVRRHAVDAVLSEGEAIPAMLASGGFQVPGQLAFASLNLLGTDGALAGVVQNHDRVGSAAVELLSILLQTHRTGESPTPSITFVPGYWREGASAPSRVLMGD